MSFHTDPDQLVAAFARLKGITFDDALKFLSGKTTMSPIMGEMGWMANTIAQPFTRGPVQSKNVSRAIGRMAGSKLGRGIARVIPGLTVAGTVMDAADILTGDESLGNKAMDTTGMVLGGTLGAALGGPLAPVTAAAGASVGKMGSDTLQWLFGDRKTPEQRKLEQALAMLQGGLI